MMSKYCLCKMVVLSEASSARCLNDFEKQIGLESNIGGLQMQILQQLVRNDLGILAKENARMQ